MDQMRMHFEEKWEMSARSLNTFQSQAMVVKMFFCHASAWPGEMLGTKERCASEWSGALGVVVRVATLSRLGSTRSVCFKSTSSFYWQV